jgi:hypothetical protein
MQPALLREVKRRRDFLREIDNGHQPTRVVHESYFRLGLLVEKNGVYKLTRKARSLFINNDPLLEAQAAFNKAQSTPTKYPWE